MLCGACRLERCRRNNNSCDRCRVIALDEMYALRDRDLGVMNQQGLAIRAYDQRLSLARAAVVQPGGADERLRLVQEVLDIPDADNYAAAPSSLLKKVFNHLGWLMFMLFLKEKVGRGTLISPQSVPK